MIEIAVGTALCLLALSLAAAFMRGLSAASASVYGAGALFCIALAFVGVWTLMTQAGAVGMRVPVGLPWLGAHPRLDALSAVFLTLLGAGGAAASVYAMGNGRHVHEPHRVLPLYPGFLGAMALVLLAADAFTFLLSWESMSLLAWALVLALMMVGARSKADLLPLHVWLPAAHPAAPSHDARASCSWLRVRC